MMASSQLHPIPAPFSSHRSDTALQVQGAESLLYKTDIFDTVPISSTSTNDAGVVVTTPANVNEGERESKTKMFTALKVRPAKSYRHPILDRRLTKMRLLAEARVLVRCRREGVNVPAVLSADWDNGWVCVEWVRGWTVRKCLDWVEETAHRPSEEDEAGGGATGEDTADRSSPEVIDADGVAEEARTVREMKSWLKNETVVRLMGQVGHAVGRLHAIGVVHGDLTTSNMIVSPVVDTSTSGSCVDTVFSTEPNPLTNGTDTMTTATTTTITLIDFGLASQTQQDEDRAVDLYVLERAFASTHPKMKDLFDSLLLPAYRIGFETGLARVKAGKGQRGKRVGAVGGSSTAASVLRKLEDVRMRGRKKSMVG